MVRALALEERTCTKRGDPSAVAFVAYRVCSRFVRRPESSKPAKGRVSVRRSKSRKSRGNESGCDRVREEPRQAVQQTLSSRAKVSPLPAPSPSAPPPPLVCPPAAQVRGPVHSRKPLCSGNCTCSLARLSCYPFCTIAIEAVTDSSRTPERLHT